MRQDHAQPHDTVKREDAATENTMSVWILRRLAIIKQPSSMTLLGRFSPQRCSICALVPVPEPPPKGWHRVFMLYDSNYLAWTGWRFCPDCTLEFCPKCSLKQRQARVL